MEITFTPSNIVVSYELYVLVLGCINNLMVP